MRKTNLIILIVITLLMLNSCMSLNIPVAATSNPIGELVGQSSGIIWLGLFGNVDAGIREAAFDGGITKISTVDLKYEPLFIGYRFTCTVTGS